MWISKKFFLTAEEEKSLEWIEKMDCNWRKRERAKTLLILNETKSSRLTAQRVGLHQRTVGETRRDWVKRGFESLVDRPRCGAPSKISQEQLEIVLAKAVDEPSSTKQLLSYHIEQGGTVVHPATLMNAIKSHGFLWKRTRHSLKKNEMKRPLGRQSKT